MLQFMSGEKLNETVWSQFFKDNPQLKRGETMQGPVAFARNGTLIVDLYAVIPDEYIIEAVSLKVNLTPSWELPNLELGRFFGWAYPYQVLSPSYFSPQKKLGEMTTVMDPDTFEPKEVAVTQQMIDAARYVILRFAIPGLSRCSSPS